MQFWDSIDTLPIYYFNKIQETGDLRFLCFGQDFAIMEPNKLTFIQKIFGAKQKKKTFEANLLAAWDNITIEFNDLMLDNESYKNRFVTKKKRLLLEINVALYNKAIDIIKLEREQNLESAKESDSRYKFEQMVASLERQLKYTIDTKQMSVRRFYTHLNMINNG